MLEATRRAAVSAVIERGLRPGVAAKAHGIHPVTMSRWLAAYRRDGDAGLAAKPHPGGKPKMDDAACEQLKAVVETPATQHGFGSDGWVSTRLSRVMREQYHVDVHPMTIRRALAKLRITPQVPQPVPRERQTPGNLASRQDWKQTTLPSLLTNNID